MTFVTENNILDLNIFFDFNVSAGFGNFYYTWEEKKLLDSVNTADQYIILIILLYARMVNIAEKSDRQNIINLVKNSVAKVYEKLDPIDFPDWPIKVFGKEHFIWPMNFKEEDKIKKPRIYKFSLKGSRLEDVILKVNFDFGLEKILVPSSLLIGLFIITRSLNQDGLMNFYKLFIEFNNNLNWDANEFKSNRRILKAYDSMVPSIKAYQENR